MYLHDYQGFIRSIVLVHVDYLIITSLVKSVFLILTNDVIATPNKYQYDNMGVFPKIIILKPT